MVVAILYGTVYVLVLRNNFKAGADVKADICLFQLGREGFFKSDVLVLDQNGRFALSVVDNTIVVHHQASQTSTVFDIKCLPESGDRPLPYTHRPLLEARSIAPTFLPSVDSQQPLPCPLYASSWIVFQPNLVVDARLGAIWAVSLKLEPMVAAIPDAVCVCMCVCVYVCMCVCMCVCVCSEEQ